MSPGNADSLFVADILKHFHGVQLRRHSTFDIHCSTAMNPAFSVDLCTKRIVFPVFSPPSRNHRPGGC
jgi:hypothetical protein